MIGDVPYSVVMLLLFAATTSAAEADDVPVIGRPADLPFSEASAGFVRQGDDNVCPFRLEVRATPDTLEAETPLTFTVTVHALGKVRRPPVRIDLRDLPAFTRSFHVEDFIDGQKEQVGPTTWRWVYRLKPQRAGIDEIPRLPFVFYNPDVRPADKGFQVIWTDAVRITVTAAEPIIVDPKQDERFIELTTGSVILADRSGWSGPGPPLLAGVVGAPPLLCVVWYVAWRRANPDAVRRASRRRSRAARRALAALKTAERLQGKTRAEATAKAVVAYLHERFDLPIAEPTPDEAADWLRRHEQPGDDVKRLLLDCASERFGPGQAAADVVGAARSFITTTEEPPRSQSS
jgi:hypothetical protein